MRHLQKIQTDDPVLGRLQDAIANAYDPLTEASIVNGRHIAGIALTTGGATLVDHKLGRKPLGYIPVLKSADCRIWDNQATNLMPERTLALQTSANVIVSLWVY